MLILLQTLVEILTVLWRNGIAAAFEAEDCGFDPRQGLFFYLTFLLAHYFILFVIGRHKKTCMHKSIFLTMHQKNEVNESYVCLMIGVDIEDEASVPSISVVFFGSNLAE